jgi:hypothetical protein
MSLRCVFGLHRPFVSSIVERPEGFSALCEGCGLPLERPREGRWSASPPLSNRKDERV